MKKRIIIVLTLLPLLTFGQNIFSTKNLDDSCLGAEIGFEKHLAYNNSNHLERHIDMTLVNDIRDYIFLTFDLDKSYDLSFTIKKYKIFNLFDVPKSDEIYLKLKPLDDFKWFSSDHIETKNCF